MTEQELKDRLLHNEAEVAKLYGFILEVSNRAFEVSNIKDVLTQIVLELRRRDSPYAVNKALDAIEIAIKDIKEWRSLISLKALLSG